MKKPIDISQAKQHVSSLLGQNVNVKLNRGRNRIKHYVGKVSDVYENVFVVQLYNDIVDRISCSYCDVICGEIVLSAKNADKNVTGKTF